MSDEPNKEQPPQERAEQSQRAAEQPQQADDQPGAADQLGADDQLGAPSHRAAAEAAEEAFFTDQAAEDYPPLDEDDEVDPELMRLPRPRRRRNPIISLAVIVLSVYMMVYLRADMLFYLQPQQPTDLGEVQDALAAGKLQPNHHVTVTGVPDRKHALILEGGGVFSAYDSFFRLQRSKSRVFVRRHRKRRSVDRELDYRHSGRVVRFDAMPLLQRIKEHFAKTMTVAHDLPFDVARAAISGGTNTVTDRLGERLTVAADQLVWINVVRPGEWLLQFPRRLYETEAVVRQQLAQRLAGLDLLYARDDERSRMHHRFVVIADDKQVATLRERFKDRVLGVGIVKRQVSYTVPWSKLSITGDALTFNAERSFPSRFVKRPAEGDKPARLEAVKDQPRVSLDKASVLYITVGTKLVVPDDAVVIVTRDTPAGYWYYLLIYLVLGAFVVLNGWAIAARFRKR